MENRFAIGKPCYGTKLGDPQGRQWGSDGVGWGGVGGGVGWGVGWRVGGGWEEGGRVGGVWEGEEGGRVGGGWEEGGRRVGGGWEEGWRRVGEGGRGRSGLVLVLVLLSFSNNMFMPYVELVFSSN